MFNHSVKIRVRYGETDQMGYVYYGNYAEYFEVGRVEMLRSLGLSYKELEVEHGILMPVTSLKIRYVRPAHYDDELKIITTLRELPGKRIVFHVEIFKEEAKMVCSGEVRLCFIDKISGASLDTPSQIIDRLKPYFT